MSGPEKICEPPLLHRAFIALGSNIDPERHLPQAVHLLAGLGQLRGTSRVYESRAVGDPESANYLNAAVLLLTPLSPLELRHAGKSIESQLGRVRVPGNPNAPRTIDIDIALYDQATLEVEGRLIPDPQIRERSFVAMPLADLDPDYLDPVSGQSLAAIAATLQSAGDLVLRADVVLPSGADAR